MAKIEYEMYALVELSGKQFKVEPGAILKVPRLQGESGDKLSLDKVLYLNDDKKVSIGKPFIKGITVDANIVSHGRDRKIIVFKFKRRKRYKRTLGHRQGFTTIQINKVNTTKKKTAGPKIKTTTKTAAKTAPKKKTTTKKVKE